MRISLLAPALLLAACGYSPLYAPQDGAANAAQRLQVGTVQMTNAAKNVGQRRAAQVVSQRLQLEFPQSNPNFDRVDINITESTSTLSVQTSAAIQRAQINLTAAINLNGTKGEELLKTTVSTNAAYNVENTPYSTESGKTFARLTAARNLADEISRRLYLYYRTHGK